MDATNIAESPTSYTVRDALVLCGIDDTSVFKDRSQAKRMASDIFNDAFCACMDKTFDDLESDFKTYSNLTVNQGQIRLNPGTKNC